MALLLSWLWAALLTCAPVFGLGLYYDPRRGKCLRYREAQSATDFAYAIIYVIFGENTPDPHLHGGRGMWESNLTKNSCRS
uniref:Uncharacterized protein n=1 Tax=Bombyx mori TaxID=7091 RepID=A0A8R2RAG0_BOMMO|nr:uncharacterized protein LOC101746233 isoform X2 [Bombyx mori]